MGFAGALAAIAAACGSEHGSECFYANRCLKACGGPVVKSGCDVVCEPPLIEQMKCMGPNDAATDSPDLIQDTGADVPSDAPADAPPSG